MIYWEYRRMRPNKTLNKRINDYVCKCIRIKVEMIIYSIRLNVRMVPIDDQKRYEYDTQQSISNSQSLSQIR